jgi:GNAT superfamily N-acetyltransferase
VSWTHPRVAGIVTADAAAGRLYAVTDGEGDLIATFAVCAEPDDYFATIAWSERDAPARYLHRLAVSPALHNYGIGAWVLGRAEAIAAAQGARYLRLDALEKDDRVLQFYGRHGYIHRGTVWVDSGIDEPPRISLACFERAIGEA